MTILIVFLQLTDLIYAVEITCPPIFRDVRRLVVALSRARLGLYVVARSNVFMNCFELTPAFKQARLLIFKVQTYLMKHSAMLSTCQAAARSK